MPPMESTLKLLSKIPERKHKELLGQFLTPRPIADFMASLFSTPGAEVELLDAGAGAGALTAALVLRLCDERRKPKRISVTAFELDAKLIKSLRVTLSACRQQCEQRGIIFSATVFNEDFIAAAVHIIRGDLFATRLPQFNAAIVNPPYCKISSDSSARLLLRTVCIETSNLYTGFVALITKLLVDGGELVAITPRSFCNGPYFKPFREDFLSTMSLRHLHVFESRSSAFIDDDVLQENVIVRVVKGGPKPKRVVVSTSTGIPGCAVAKHRVDYRDVVSPHDTDQFIHLPINHCHAKAKSAMNHFSSTLAELGLSVSTGRVVDFRAEPYLCQEPGKNTVPLIYPCHFNGGFVHWPKRNSRKPNAIIYTKQTQELLVPAGVYVLVKRFSAKEERRRIVACIYDPRRIQAKLVGFENHLNYFHVQGHGMSKHFAKGLAAFLNSTFVDLYFRQFSGHTQVNATDLRALKYPTKSELERVGRKIVDPGMAQHKLDKLVKTEFF